MFSKILPLHFLNEIQYGFAELRSYTFRKLHQKIIKNILTQLRRCCRPENTVVRRIIPDHLYNFCSLYLFQACKQLYRVLVHVLFSSSFVTSPRRRHLNTPIFSFAALQQDSEKFNLVLSEEKVIISQKQTQPSTSV